ncbi:MAG: methyltransferase domain-containing protein [Candidatus Sericytochromatia bacterium]|nr:methyltransferase domain-containing protein [Candidatus Sericytochromatia bacterium]
MDKITCAIKKQYNQFPYPSIPIGDLQDVFLYSTNYEFVNYLCTGVYKSAKNIKILDAGCGTGYSTLKLAQQNPEAQIFAFDLSENSLKMAKERLEKAEVLSDQIHFFEADLMNLPDLKQTFDYIVCTGVLHHTSSPELGINNLSKYLKDDAIMYLMLYSEYGRFYLNQTRKAIKLLQSDQEDLNEGMEIGKELFGSLNENNPLFINYQRSYNASTKIISEDFADSEAQFIDSYVNAHERTYNIEQLFELLEKNNLHFLRFQDANNWDIKKIFRGNQKLIDKCSYLSQKQKYQLGEIIFAEKNFAFFTAKINFQKPIFSDEELSKKKILVSKFNKLIQIDDEILITNPLGNGMQFTEESIVIYNALFDSGNISDLIINFAKMFGMNYLQTLGFIRELESACILFFI